MVGHCESVAMRSVPVFGNSPSVPLVVVVSLSVFVSLFCEVFSDLVGQRIVSIMPFQKDLPWSNSGTYLRGDTDDKV